MRMSEPCISSPCVRLRMNASESSDAPVGAAGAAAGAGAVAAGFGSVSSISAATRATARPRVKRARAGAPTRKASTPQRSAQTNSTGTARIMIAKLAASEDQPAGERAHSRLTREKLHLLESSTLNKPFVANPKVLYPARRSRMNACHCGRRAFGGGRAEILNKLSLSKFVRHFSSQDRKKGASNKACGMRCAGAAPPCRGVPVGSVPLAASVGPTEADGTYGANHPQAGPPHLGRPRRCYSPHPHHPVGSRGVNQRSRFARTSSRAAARRK